MDILEYKFERYFLQHATQRLKLYAEQNLISISQDDLQDISQALWGLCRRSGIRHRDNIHYMMERVLDMGLRSRIIDNPDAQLPGIGHSELVRIERYLSDLVDQPPLLIHLPENDVIMEFYHG